MVERKATQQPHRTVDVGTRADKSSVRAYTTMSAFLQEKASSIEPKVSSVAQDEKIAAEFVASNHADPTESVEISLLKVRGYIQHTFNRDAPHTSSRGGTKNRAICGQTRIIGSVLLP